LLKNLSLSQQLLIRRGETDISHQSLIIQEISNFHVWLIDWLIDWLVGWLVDYMQMWIYFWVIDSKSRQDFEVRWNEVKRSHMNSIQFQLNW
jgi:hypothetical protein